MGSILSSVLGGVGLFLLGMTLLTEGLKALAGNALRSVLSRYTTNRFSACAAGAGITAVVQSSSATTVATLGFVSAGLLPFSNAIGVVIGANLGTTSTGWLVSLLGLKLSIGSVMLPLIGLGAFVRLVTHGKIAHAGSALAGFGVIFVGIDILQEGMQGLAQEFDPSTWPQATLGGRALLVLIGLLMTVVMQSSSAAVATTLAALSGGAIDVEQAAALVVGQNIGTTVTAGIASIGGSAPAKRTALAHVLFNVVTAAAAFAVLPWLTRVVETFVNDTGSTDHSITIAAFHTAFNLLGAALFLPFTPQLARFLEMRIRIRGSKLTQHLDRSLFRVPSLAVDVARRTLKEIAVVQFRQLAETLHGRTRWLGGAGREELVGALGETRDFLSRTPPSESGGAEFRRQLSTLHALDHMERLAQDSAETGSLEAARRLPVLRGVAEGLSSLAQMLALQIADPAQEPEAERAREFSLKLADERRTARPAILEATASRRIDAEQALEELRAQRWLDRLAYHVWRVSHHLREMTRRDEPSPENGSADAGPHPAAAIASPRAAGDPH